MADDNNSRYRSNDPYGRGPAPTSPANDPLAELARLIGQSDPFAELGREPRPSPRPSEPRDTRPRYSDPPQPYGSEPAPRPGDVPPFPFGSDPAPPYNEPYNDPPQPYGSEPAPRPGDVPPFRFGSDPAPPFNDPPQPYGSEPASRPGDVPPFRFGSDPAPPFNDPPRAYGSEPASRPGDEPPFRFGSDPAPPFNDPPQPYGSEPAPRFGADDAPRYGDDQPASGDWPGGAARARPYSPADPFTLPLPKAVERRDDAKGFGESHSEPALEVIQPDRSGFDPAGIEREPEPPPFAPPLYPHESAAGSMPPPHDDEFYDDAPRSNRRKGLLTVAAVLGLAAIGTAGAFGYRNYFGGSGASSPPPVIRASGAPSKVAPPPSNTEQTASKFSYDRFSDRGKDEQVVVRQEKPVDTKDLAQSSMARTTLPAPSTAGSPGKSSPVMSSPGMPSNAGGGAAANPPSALGEPRRVRTVQIRPEEPDVAGSPQPAAPSPRQARVAAVAPVNPPTQLEPPPTAARAPSTRTAPQRPSPAANAPLSLRPNGNNALPPPPSAQASAPPSRAPAPTRLAAAPSGGGGRYLVQVSSQRSEADAQSSFRSIQAKYANVLGGQPHVVRRADLGSRGVYYRAMVGPFGTREQAIQLCSSLKAAGGDCVVQTN